MPDEIGPFAFDYQPGKILFGRECVADLKAELDRQGLDRALVVCGRTVGSTPAVVDPVTDGLGDALVAVFDRTTPEKYLRTAYEAARLVRGEQVDALVAVGGGSSLDTAKVVAALAAHNRPLREVTAESIERGSVPVPDDGDPTAIVAIPTTLAGADLSVIGGVTLTMDPDKAPDRELPSGGVGDPRLMPVALFYDPALFETTPRSVLAASAMNGFDKAVEALYVRHRTPVTDATAMRALRLLESSLSTVADEELDEKRLSQVITGIVLAQYGVSEPGRYKLSIIHAFGHGFSRDYEAHQGTIHGIVAPHVLRYLFERVNGRRDLLAEGLAVDDEGQDADETAEAVVEAVARLRDDLGLPSQLREVDGLTTDHLPDIAAAIMNDSLMSTVPEGLDPTREEIEGVLRDAW